MSFEDFVIRYGHKFLRNIYTEKQINHSEHAKDLESYYDIFDQYIEICIGMLTLLNSVNRHNFINYAIEEFVEDNSAGEETSETKNTITKTEIKNLLLGNDFKNIPKFNLKVYAYVYNELIIFHGSDIQYDTITTNKFFINPSHRIGEIIGYAHDFCNSILMEQENSEISFIAHNFFGFDLFCL